MRYQGDMARYRMADRMREAERARLAMLAHEAEAGGRRLQPRRQRHGVLLTALAGVTRYRRLARAGHVWDQRMS